MEKIYDVLNQSSLSYEEKLKIGSVILEEYFKEKEKMLTEKVTNNKITWGKSSKVEMTWDEAKKWCEAQGGRLPKLWELLKAFEDKEEGFTSNYYWSSTEHSATYEYGVYFTRGDTCYDNKTDFNYVRCIFDK